MLRQFTCFSCQSINLTLFCGQTQNIGLAVSQCITLAQEVVSQTPKSCHIPGIIDPTTLSTAYHEKIQPLFASGNVFADRQKLEQFSLFFEAQKCLTDLGCIDAYLKGVEKGVDPFPRHEDTSDGSWEGVHILSPWEFRTKILGGDGSEEWMVYLTSHTDSKYVNLMREAILDGQSIMRYDVDYDHEKVHIWKQSNPPISEKLKVGVPSLKPLAT
eukprot:sb/3470020/